MLDNIKISEDTIEKINALTAISSQIGVGIDKPKNEITTDNIKNISIDKKNED